MHIDVYDFDGTIYDGDSTADFVLFTLRRHPALLPQMLRLIVPAAKLLVKRMDLTRFKSALLGILASRIDLDAEAEAFWQSPEALQKLGSWFEHTPRDLPIVIASASPEFELTHAARLLGVHTLIGTRCCVATGMLIGKNCKGAEKIDRIRQAIGPFTVRAMYTDDAKADGPLLAIAKERYLVTHGSVRRLP